mmetsp:Transcript_6431/g.26348  ORF Transcript_6431/g.26348 Transcript_6431/m.26348 type:complete len:407 (+) Transcript_6431:1196-2416(+)
MGRRGGNLHQPIDVQRGAWARHLERQLAEHRHEATHRDRGHHGHEGLRPPHRHRRQQHQCDRRVAQEGHRRPHVRRPVRRIGVEPGHRLLLKPPAGQTRRRPGQGRDRQNAKQQQRRHAGPGPPQPGRPAHLHRFIAVRLVHRMSWAQGSVPGAEPGAAAGAAGTDRQPRQCRKLKWDSCRPRWTTGRLSSRSQRSKPSGPTGIGRDISDQSRTSASAPAGISPNHSPNWPGLPSSTCTGSGRAYQATRLASVQLCTARRATRRSAARALARADASSQPYRSATGLPTPRPPSCGSVCAASPDSAGPPPQSSASTIATTPRACHAARPSTRRRPTSYIRATPAPASGSSASQAGAAQCGKGSRRADSQASSSSTGRPKPRQSTRASSPTARGDRQAHQQPNTGSRP